MINDRNVLCKPDKQEILNKLSEMQNIDTGYQPFGDGYSANKIVSAIENFKHNIY